MAEPAESVEKGVEELEKEITCAVCHGHYDEPKVLPCCHYYCKECVYSLALRTGLDKLFSCPECRMDVTLPQGSVDNLQTAFFINRLKQVHSKLEKTHGKVDAKCELCYGAKAEAFCRQCASLICVDCVKSHQKMKKTFSGHKVSSLEELKAGLSVRDIVMEESPLQMCKLHIKQPLAIYCFDCSCLICRDCTIKNHLGHNYEFIDIAAPGMKKKLIEHLYRLEEVKTSLSHAVKEIQSTQSEIEAQGDSVNNKLESWFEHFHKIIEQRKQELLKEVATKVTQKLNRLSVQEKKLSTKCAVIQSVIEYTQQCVKHSADDEIMCMHAEIKSRIEREIEEHRKKGRSLKPMEEVDIGMEVSCAEELKELCQTKARVTQIPVECTVEGEGVKTAEINKLSELSVIVKLSDGKNVKQKYGVDCHLKTLANGSTVKCKVNLIQDNEYLIQYTPTVRGRHELVLTVNGQEVASSPFPVFVSIPPTQLGIPVKVIRGLTNPCFSAINSVGEIIITAEWRDVTVFDKEGKKLRNINTSYYNIKDPTGVAVDETDSIYIAGNGRSHNIMKFNKEMKLVKEVSVKQNSQLYGVAVVGDEVMVCDSGYSCVMVYTKELEYVRQIGSPGKSPGQFDIRDVSSDEHGNLYVCEGEHKNVYLYSVAHNYPGGYFGVYPNEEYQEYLEYEEYPNDLVDEDYPDYRIQVLSNGGEYLRSIGCNKLDFPFGVCLSGQYVYVADTHNHNISVYTTMGEYVTTLGQEGSNEGEYSCPRGVCTDKDGYIYVCDCGNNRVQIL